MYNIRTDLALESRNNIFDDSEKVRGIRVSEEKDCINDINIVRMEVLNHYGAQAIKRPIGTYVTMEVPNLCKEDEDYHKEIAKALCLELRSIIKKNYQWPKSTPNILVAGLGNRDATSDALGPRVVSNLLITRHIVEYMGYAEIEGAFAITSAIVPGVMAQTGIDTGEILEALINQTEPDILLVIDALAARDTHRLCSTIQITDTGIHPGSGVGNNRNQINKKTMGIPVIAIGVPTVVDASTLIYDSITNKTQNNKVEIAEEYRNMYVTSKDIDAIIKRVSFTISEGINKCISGEIK